jgi:site-specific DNA-cytosine methylase
MLAVADIYCGAGGLSAGVSSARFTSDDGTVAGFEVVFGVDRVGNCMRSFRRNHFPDLDERTAKRRAPRRSVVGLTGKQTLRAAGVDRIPMIVGGPNCQGVSAAGLRNP